MLKDTAGLPQWTDRAIEKHLEQLAEEILGQEDILEDLDPRSQRELALQAVNLLADLYDQRFAAEQEQLRRRYVAIENQF